MDMNLSQIEDFLGQRKFLETETDKFARTVMAGRNQQNQRCGATKFAAFARLRSNLRAGIAIPYRKDTTDETPLSTLEIVGVVDQVWGICSLRKFVVALDRQLGVVPKLTNPGDLIVALHGGQFLLVLRPKGAE